MDKLAGTQTWHIKEDEEDDITIKFKCSQRAMASGEFDHFKNVEL